MSGREERASVWRTIRTYVPRAFPYLRPYRTRLVITIVVTLATVGLSLAEPWPLAFLVDGVLSDGSALPSIVTRFVGAGTGQLVMFAVVAGFVLALLSGGLSVINSYVHTRMEQRMILDFRSDLFQHVQRLSLAFHEGARKGQLMFAINNQASAVGEIVLSFLPLAQALLTLVGMFVVAFRLNSLLALLSLTVVPFVYYSIGHYGSRIEPQLRRVRGLEGTSLAIVHEAMSMMRVIVAFGRERYEHRRFLNQGTEAVDARTKVTVKQTGFSLGVNLITAAGTGVVLWFGAHLVLRRQMTVGELLVVISYVAAVYQPLEQVSTAIATMQERLIALEAAVNLLDTQPEVVDPHDGVVLDRAKGRLEFKQVGFSYKGRRDTLKDVSFQARPGEVIAIVGPTGAGKTTLVSLIPRFSDLKEGRILLDGHDLSTIKLESLRNQISIVLQEPLLFSGTIRDNIRYGRLDATFDDVVAAAKAANAHGFIDRLPNKYETALGEGGARLSGGERQRISIARAFLKDAPIVILDEPTSSVDSRTEAVILESLSRLVEGRTTFVIAHRLATVRHANRILVIDEGRVTQQGTHDELLEQGGLYREMYEAQTGRKVAEERIKGTAKLPEPLPSPGLSLAPSPALQPPVGVESFPQSVAANGDGSLEVSDQGNGRPDGVPAVLVPALSSAGHSGVNGGGRSEIEPVDLNRATLVQLASVPGIGPTTARAIVKERRAGGRFESIEELRAVPGISRARLERLRPFLEVGPEAASPGSRLVRPGGALLASASVLVLTVFAARNSGIVPAPHGQLWGPEPVRPPVAQPAWGAESLEGAGRAGSPLRGGAQPRADAASSSVTSDSAHDPSGQASPRPLELGRQPLETFTEPTGLPTASPPKARAPIGAPSSPSSSPPGPPESNVRQPPRRKDEGKDEAVPEPGAPPGPPARGRREDHAPHASSGPPPEDARAGDASGRPAGPEPSGRVR